MVRQLLDRFFINPFVASIILLLVGGLFYVFYTQVDLTPQITSSFFFSPDSKIYKDDALIYKKFIVGDSVVLSLPAPDIKDPNYLKRITALTKAIEKAPGVLDVQSVTQGPPNVDAALTHPMWTRFLDSGSGKNSLIVCFIDLKKVGTTVSAIKKIIQSQTFRDHPIYISGIPYIIEEIRQMLMRDMKQFIMGAIVISTALLLLIFMSLFVAIGAIVAALTAAALSLVVQSQLGVPIGILTANLGAIVYVLTVSHVVFLTSNWRQDSHQDKRKRLASTLVTTLPASFWAATTTVFGFVSLMFVEAKPLQQLGVGGSIGALAALLMAYLLFPLFLRFSKLGKSKKEARSFWLPLPLMVGVPLALCLLGGAGAMAWLGADDINTDPSLLTYFKKDQEIYKGILQLDRFGGSNPLNFVVSDPSGKNLTNQENYKKMQALQEDVEGHPAVGAVLSLPVLMEETQENWLARLLPWGSLMSILSRDRFGKVARGFITEDQEQGLFMLRMKESGRSVDRHKIINQLMAKPRKHGLRLDTVGGSYYMQSRLAQKIRKSMKTGIAALLLLFVVIILLLSVSIPITLYAGLSIVGVTAAFLGCVGYFGVPVDIISSPSINVVLGLAVDGMIHIILAARRLSAAKGFRTDKEGWVAAIRSQGPPVFISGLVIGAGFSVFYLSNFPPSQRFGLEIVFGTFLAIMMTLFVLPHLAMLFRKAKS